MNVKRMQFLLLLLFLLPALAGCGKKEPTKEDDIEETVSAPPKEEEYKVKLSDKLSDFQFAVNDQVYTLPSNLTDWEANGWSYTKEDQNAALESDSFLEGEALVKEDETLTIDLANPGNEKKLLRDCFVGGVTLEVTENTELVYQLPKHIRLGKSELEDVTKAYGEPTDQYEEEDKIFLTYEFGIYKQAEFVFDVQDEILLKAVLKNYREPEDENDTVNKELPESVKNYQAPGAFSEDIQDFVVRYAGEFYKLPAPASEFVKNGWKIVEEDSDKTVKSGRHGYITLEKNGQTLYAVVINYSDSTVPVKNCFVTNVTGDFDVTKVSIELFKGITLGMAEETMKALLDKIPYETQEEDNGITYLIYKDESKKDYTKIIVDKELRLIREIDMSNSPESLDPPLPGTDSPEEPAESVDAPVMYGKDELPDETDEEYGAPQEEDEQGTE